MTIDDFTEQLIARGRAEGFADAMRQAVDDLLDVERGIWTTAEVCRQWQLRARIAETARRRGR